MDKEELIKSLDIDVGDADEVTLLKVNLRNGKGINLYYPGLNCQEILGILDENEKINHILSLDEFLDYIMVLKV